jgi:cold shock CspA family protein
MSTGTIRHLNSRGYGFISTADYGDFFHANSMEAGEFDSLEVGDIVSFEYSESRGQRRAYRVVKEQAHA